MNITIRLSYKTIIQWLIKETDIKLLLDRSKCRVKSNSLNTRKLMRQKDERIKIHGAAIIEKGGEAG